MKQKLFGKEYFEGEGSNYSKSYKNLKAVWLDKLNILLEFKQSGKLLDVGCAFGHFCAVAGANFDCEGLDISEYVIKESKKLYPDIKFYTDDILNHSINKRFDVITAFDILEHVKRFDQALRNIKKLLKKDGIFIVQTPFMTPIYKRFQFLDKDTTHFSIFTEEELLRRLKKHFKILKILYYTNYLAVIHPNLLILKFPNWFKSLSTIILIVGKN